MDTIRITDLPADVQAKIRAVTSTAQVALVLDDDGAVIANITAIPNRRPEPNRGVQVGHGNTQFNQF